MLAFLKKQTRRLGSDTDYKRPKRTITDSLQTRENILKKLEGYTQVEHVSNLPIGTHVRYITWKNNAQRFCTGGWIRKIHEDYVVLESKRFSWSVQRFHYKNKKKIFTTLFFKKQSKFELYEHALKQQQIEIQKQQMEIQKLKRLIQYR